MTPLRPQEVLQEPPFPGWPAKGSSILRRRWAFELSRVLLQSETKVFLSQRFAALDAVISLEFGGAGVGCRSQAESNFWHRCGSGGWERADLLSSYFKVEKGGFRGGGAEERETCLTCET